MRCFTFFHGKITPGIQTTLSHKKKRRLVFLGAKGLKCVCKIVFFDKGNEPDIDENELVHYAYPTKRKFNKKNKRTGQSTPREEVVLKKAYESPTKILLRINTSTASVHKINGRWQEVGGWPTDWVNAHGFSKGQRWRDDLIVMDDCDIIMVVPAGAGRSERMIVRNDRGVISCIPELEYHRIVEAHEKEMAAIEARQESAEEAVEDKTETVDAGDDYDLETKEKTSHEETKAESSNDEVEEGKAPHGESMETVLHSKEGETIGA